MFTCVADLVWSDLWWQNLKCPLLLPFLLPSFQLSRNNSIGNACYAGYISLVTQWIFPKKRCSLEEKRCVTRKITAAPKAGKKVKLSVSFKRCEFLTTTQSLYWQKWLNVALSQQIVLLNFSVHVQTISKPLARIGVETSSILHQLKTKSVISGVTPPPIRTELWGLTSIPRLDIYGGRIKVFCVPVDDWLIFLHRSLNVAICFLVMQTTVETKNWTTSVVTEVLTEGAALAIHCGSTEFSGGGGNIPHVWALLTTAPVTKILRQKTLLYTIFLAIKRYPFCIPSINNKCLFHMPATSLLSCTFRESLIN